MGKTFDSEMVQCLTLTCNIVYGLDITDLQNFKPDLQEKYSYTAQAKTLQKQFLAVMLLISAKDQLASSSALST